MGIDESSMVVGWALTALGKDICVCGLLRCGSQTASDNSVRGANDRIRLTGTCEVLTRMLVDLKFAGCGNVKFKLLEVCTA